VARSLQAFSRADQDDAVDALVDFIVSGAHPFSLVEDERFISFCNLIAPDFRVPVRQTIQTKVMARWNAQKQLVRAQLIEDLHNRRAGFTTDMWTSPAKRGYMVVTMHYIDSDRENAPRSPLQCVDSHGRQRIQQWNHDPVSEQPTAQPH
jgi:hypothetical protein